MYDYPRRSIRKRVIRVARQRGWIGQGGNGMVLPIVVLVLAAVVALWLAGFVISLIPAALVGLLAGWAASKLTGTRLGVGWTMLAGIAGSWLGSAIFSGLLHVPVGGLLSPVHLVASVLGAAVLITFVRVVARPSLPGAPRPRLGRGY